MSKTPQDKRVFPEEMHEKKSFNQHHKTLGAWLLALVIIFGLGFIFYQLFYKTLPDTQDVDIFEQKVFTKEEQEAIVNGLENSATPFTEEERTAAIEGFLGVYNEN